MTARSEHRRLPTSPLICRPPSRPAGANGTENATRIWTPYAIGPDLPLVEDLDDLDETVVVALSGLRAQNRQAGPAHRCEGLWLSDLRRTPSPTRALAGCAPEGSPGILRRAP